MQDDQATPAGDDQQKPSAFNEALQKHTDTEINPDTQAMLNKPLAGSMDDADKTFLQDVVTKAEKKEINLHEPQSLLNKDIYENLAPEQEQKVDLILQTLLFSLRQIVSWHEAGEQENVQMANMIHDVRVKKENLENEVGDVLKI
jgi:uncharacterized protein YciU (UPF0263 family)